VRESIDRRLNLQSYHCKTCGRSELAEKRPNDWWRLALGGERRITSTDAKPGLYCSLDCLTVAVLAPYGLSETQVREWLAGAEVS
jgi:hypothetical protein